MMMTLLSGGTLHLEQLVLFTTLILWWALMRPMMVRDYDSRKLPPNPAARIIVVFMYVLIYLVLAFSLDRFGQSALPYLAPLPFVASLVKSMENQAPLLAIATLGGLWQVAFFRDLERALLVSLHSTRHLHSDSQLLARHLARCVFNPSAVERNLDLNHLRKYGVFVEGDDVGPADLMIVNNWRKVSSLLRLVRVWNEDAARLLSPQDMEVLDEIETAHERKTQLAMNIIKTTQHAADGKEASRLLSDLMQSLSATLQLDRSNLADVEARARTILGAGAQSSAPLTVKLSAQELRNCIYQIQGYFEVEYDALLQRLAELAAKSTVLAGPAGAERLDALKAAGFLGLGRIDRISLDNVLWLFLVASVGGFLIKYISNIGDIGTAPGQTNPEVVARFAFTMAIAGLIGAIVGSIRRYARAPIAPWSVYLAAGITAAFLYVGIIMADDLLKEFLGIEPQAGRPPFSLVRQAPWSLVPLMLTVAVCYLARLKSWSELLRLGPYGSYLDRVIDGACVSAAVLLGYYAAVALHPLLHMELPAGLAHRIAMPHTLPIPINTSLQVQAFLIGFFFVRDARRVAHATIVESAAALVPRFRPTKLADASPASAAAPMATPAE
jgi:hypothetical protein